MSINGQMDKGDMVHICTHSGISYNHKKNKILPFATIWIDLEGIRLSEIKSEEDKYKNISLTCEILKKNNFFKLMNTGNRLVSCWR